MTERAYARRRRAAVPAALAALLFLVIVAGSDAPARFTARDVAPAMTIVIPPTVAASAPADEPLAEPPADVVPFEPAPVPQPPPVEEPAAPADETPAEQPADTPATEEPTEEEPAVRHVFLVVLSQTDLVALADQAAAAPDAPPAPYLTGELVPQGTLLTSYASVARGPLANGVALVSGQGPTQATLAGCPPEAGAQPGTAPPDVTPDEVGPDGQQLGDGCVYPFATGTVADQLVGAGLDWRAYLEAPPAAPDAAPPAACPAIQRNPFAYFHSLLDTGACARRVGGLDRLGDDLARGARAPALLYVVPNACHDGAPEPCAPGAPAGPAAADAFLRDVVPQILGSAAFADGGLLVVTSDAPPAAGAAPVARPEPAGYPNVGDAASAGAARVGALLVGGGARAGARSDAPAGHFALLRAISDSFALQPLGYASNSTVDLVNSALSSSER